MKVHSEWLSSSCCIAGIGIAPITMAEQGLDAASNALELYGMVQRISWDGLQESISVLDANSDAYSSNAAEVVNRIRTALETSIHHHEYSSQHVANWCSSSYGGLTFILDSISWREIHAIAELHTDQLIAILSEGANQMEIAIEQLEESKDNFNYASGQLKYLSTVLDHDYSEESAFYDEQYNKVRKEAYAGALSGAAYGGIIGLAIAYTIAASVVEAKSIPDLKRSFEETRQKFDNLQNVITDAQDTISQTKKALDREILILTEMASEIELTEIFADSWSDAQEELLSDVISGIRNIIERCGQLTSDF